MTGGMKWKIEELLLPHKHFVVLTAGSDQFVINRVDADLLIKAAETAFRGGYQFGKDDYKEMASERWNPTGPELGWKLWSDID